VSLLQRASLECRFSHNAGAPWILNFHGLTTIDPTCQRKLDPAR